MNRQAGRATLGDLVVRAALIDAQRRVAASATPQDAAARACRGAWAPFRRAVEQRLCADSAAVGAAGDNATEPVCDTLVPPGRILVAVA